MEALIWLAMALAGVLLGPWIVRVARGEVRLAPRTRVITRRGLTQAAIVVGIGLSLLSAALVLQSSGGR